MHTTENYAPIIIFVILLVFLIALLLWFFFATPAGNGGGEGSGFSLFRTNGNSQAAPSTNQRVTTPEAKTDNLNTVPVNITFDQNNIIELSNDYDPEGYSGISVNTDFDDYKKYDDLCTN